MLSLLSEDIMKEIIIGLAGILLLALILYQKPNVVNPMGLSSKPTPSKTAIKKSTLGNEINAASQPSPSSNNHNEKKLTGNTHLDQLSPKMKQAIRNKLYHHNTKEAVIDNSGGTLVPMNGKYVQIPVAVQMPDGSIEIKEYSYIPE
jgi:hypothetical protein